MVWVKSEYADELAVLVTWLSMVLPWSAAYHTKGPLESTIVFIRFSVFELQLRFPSNITLNGVPLDIAKALAAQYSGFKIAGNFYAAIPPTAALDYTGPLAYANAVWTAGALVMLSAFVMSLAMYFREEWTRKRLPIEYPRLAGWLLAVATALFAVTTGLMWMEQSIVGIPIPVGLLVIGAFAIALLRADTIEAVDSDDNSNDSDKTTDTDSPADTANSTDPSE